MDLLAAAKEAVAGATAAGAGAADALAVERRETSLQVRRGELETSQEAETRGVPIYVLKANTMLQMEACLTSLFSLNIDPSEAALREVEEAIGLVMTESRPVELSPQSPALRRLQHQVAERANLVSRSRGREPYRRVRVYPDRVRAWR